MDRAWSIRDFRDGDEGEINELFNSVFNRRRRLENWYWKFTNNPEGSIMYNAMTDSKLVGHLGALNRRITIKGRESPALLEVDGMTHPDYGHQGIFTTLGRELLSESRKKGANIAYGFPNEYAMPGHRKLGCVELFKLNAVIKPIHFDRIAQKTFSNKITAFFANLAQKFAFSVIYRTKRVHLDDDVVLKRITEFDARFDDLWKKAQDSHDIILRRDSTYLNWRYVQCPEKYYKVYAAEKNDEVLAWVVVRVMDRYGLKNGIIADMLSLPDRRDILCALVQLTCEELKKEDVDLIACSIPKNTHYFKAIRQSGFMPCPDKLNPRGVYFIIYLLSKKIKRDVVSEPANWFVTWGDTDVV